MPNLFPNKDDGDILSSMLTTLPDALDKRPGSIIYDALAPVALELAAVYSDLDRLFDQLYADTADLPALSRITAERGMSPRPATPAAYSGECNLTPSDLPDGAKFTLGTLTFTSRIVSGGLTFVCDDAGADGNYAELNAPLIPTQYINGFTSARLTALLIPGKDGETADELRTRFFNGLKNLSYGGNIADYRDTARALDGVSAARIVPGANGAGTVRVILLDSLYEPASGTLVALAQSVFNEIAPIGHIVTVASATIHTFSLDITVQLESGVTLESLYPLIRETVEQYVLAERKTWEENNVVIRVSRIEAALLDLPGVVDLSVNSLDGASGNLVLGEAIPALGELSVAEVA